MIHPTDADKLGVADGDRGTIVSDKGQLAARVTVSNEVVPGVALVPCNLGAGSLFLLSDQVTVRVGGDSDPDPAEGASDPNSVEGRSL